MSRITENLPCKLTEEQIRQRGEQLARLLADIDHAKEEKKDAAARFKGQIDALGEQADDIAIEVRTGVEYRDVVCHDDVDYKAGVRRRYRADTGDLVSTRDLKPDEIAKGLQGKLFPIEQDGGDAVSEQ